MMTGDTGKIGEGNVMTREAQADNVLWAGGIKDSDVEMLYCGADLCTFGTKHFSEKRIESRGTAVMIDT